MPQVATLLQGREKARALGDRHLAAEFQRELDRIGWTEHVPVPFDEDDPHRALVPEQAIPAPLERAVPRRRRPRK